MKLTKIIQEMNIPLDYKQFSRDIFCIMLIDKHQDSKGRDQLSDCKKRLMPPLVIKFITCYFSSDIRELGCMKGQVFDYTTLKCVDPEVGPEDW